MPGALPTPLVDQVYRSNEQLCSSIRKANHSAVLAQLDGLEANRINQLVVEPTLQTTRDPDVFALGDCAACPRPACRSITCNEDSIDICSIGTDTASIPTT